MQWNTYEMTLSELLADPLIRAVMRADKVTTAEVKQIYQSVDTGRKMHLAGNVPHRVTKSLSDYPRLLQRLPANPAAACMC